jgi:hypothetical protein
MDPHAWARIRTRESLEVLEQLARLTDATDAGVSKAMLVEIAWLKHRLTWCDGCYSRARSIALWMWVVRATLQVVIRWMETSHCLFSAVPPALVYGYDARNDHSIFASVEKTVAGRSRGLSWHLCFLPLAA